MSKEQDSQQEHADHSFEKKELSSPFGENESSEEEIEDKTYEKEASSQEESKQQKKKQKPSDQQEENKESDTQEEVEQQEKRTEENIQEKKDSDGQKESKKQQMEEDKEEEEQTKKEKQEKSSEKKKQQKQNESNEKAEDQEKEDEDTNQEVQTEQESKDEDQDARVKDKAEIDRELREIYEDKEGRVPDMSSFKTKQSNSMLRAFLIFLLSLAFLGGVAWAGFFFFQPQDQFSEENITFSIEGDKEAKLGQKVHYRIKYDNRQNVPLSKADVNVRYPSGFEFETSSPKPTNEDNTTWKLGTIEEDSADFIDIYGKIYGDVEEKQSLRSFLNYTPANFSSPFQKVSTFNTKITKAPVKMNIEGPKKITVGEKGSWNVELISEQVEPIENLRLKVKAGDNFRFVDNSLGSTSTPKNIKEIESLTDREAFTFNGVFDSKSEENKLEFLLQSEREKEQTLEPERYLVAKSDFPLDVAETDVGFSLAINGATGDFSTRPGESLNTTLKVENNGQEAIKNAQLKMTFDAPSNDRSAVLERSLLNWGEIKNIETQDIVGEQVTDNVRRGVITWDKSAVPELAEIKPEEEVEINFTLPIKSKEVIDLTEFDTSTTTAKADLKYEMGGKVEAVSTDKIDITMNSDLSIDVKDTITENEQQEKVHNIAWTLDNSFHDLKNIEVKADVFGEIDWMEEALNATTGTAQFDSEQQKLAWNIDSLPKESQSQTLNFSVQLEEQDPTQTNLTSKVQVEARDKTTKKDIIIVGDEVLLTSSTSTTSSPL